MPSTIKLRIVEARDLPVMDRKSGLTDAYVSMSFGEHTDKTPICRKTLHPKWDHLFRVDVPEDTVLQDEPIRLTILDKDIYSSDNTIGVVILDLNCLLVVAMELKGWYPIFDTLRGVRGFLYVHVQLQFFGDVNRSFCFSWLERQTDIDMVQQRLRAVPPGLCFFPLHDYRIRNMK
uniref:C2 domain-containing protein n=1 Tax=Spongospora subterranea TaxID=70186 RepID=A0A0H5R203_9EUKA|eukprot:CRZ08253.1 hypothetical protein [Spongospora subterranea]